MAEPESPSSDLTCFVIGPIGEKDASLGSRDRVIYEEAIQVLEEIIQPACGGFGIEPIRADEIATPGEIPEQVFRHLRDSYIVIADLTDGNPNVMYELGLRHTTGKLTIPVGELERLPFDISVIRTIKFKRTAGGLIDARRKLSAAISAGLANGGDPVTATRVWFETVGISASEKPTDDGPEQTSDERAESEPLGFLEKIADTHEGFESSTRTLQAIVVVENEIGELAREFASQVQRINEQGGQPHAVVILADTLAKKLEDPAARLEVLVGEYLQSIGRISPGVLYAIERSKASETDTAEATKITDPIRSLITSAFTALGSLQGFRNSLLQSGEATRALRKVNGRIAGSLEKMVGTRQVYEIWQKKLAE
jgi:hypothetical protein